MYEDFVRIVAMVLFRPVKNNRGGGLNRPLDRLGVYKSVVRHYTRLNGLEAEVIGICVHSMRATAATNALDHEADIAKVQEWLGHANVSMNRLYGHIGPRIVRGSRFGFKIWY